MWTRRAVVAVAAAVALAGIAFAGLTALKDLRKEGMPRPPATEGVDKVFALSSPAFEDGATLPARFAEPGFPGGQGYSPPLEWDGDPAAESYVLVMLDRAQVADDFVHWAVVDVPASADSVEEDASGRELPGGRELMSTAGRQGYYGPTPPAGTGVHEYEITVYAVDVPQLEIPTRPGALGIADALKGHVIAYGTMTGKLGR